MSKTKVDALTDTLLEGGLLRVEQVAELLAVARTTVYAFMDSGLLPYVKLGRSRRVTKQAVTRFVEANTKGGWNAS